MLGVGPTDQRPSTPLPPLLYILDHCEAAISALESVPADVENPDDVDTDSEDHCADDIRYGVTSRPWIIDQLPPQKPKERPTLDDLWEDNERYQEPERV